MKIYFIYYDQDITDKKIAERILKIGDHIQPDPDKNFFLVKSDLSSVELYDGFTNGLDVSIKIIIGEVVPENTFGLWTEPLWKFFGLDTADNNKEEEENKEDESTKN